MAQHHDLHFTVQNPDGTTAIGGEQPIQGEMTHLPDSANGSTSGEQSSYISDKLKQSSHPTVVVFHLLFKGLAVITYLFGGWVLPTGPRNPNAGPHTIILTVVIILLLAADFWTVKNVTGRLLVGLRWWNKVTPEGSEWIFESAQEPRINKFDKNVFWTFLYIAPIVWMALLIWCIIQFKWSWLLVNCLAVSLASANVYGYYKCSSDQKEQFQQMVNIGAQQGALTLMRTSVLGALTGSRGNVV